MQNVNAVARAQQAHPAVAAAPSEAEIRAIRDAFNGDVAFEDLELKDTPARVQAFAEALERKERRRGNDDVYISAQQFSVGSKRYYVVSADNEGNGYAEIVNPQGQVITGYSYSESGMNGWESSPEEARRERAASAAASRLFTRSALGTSRLAQYEVRKRDLPPRLREQVSGPRGGVKEEHFYKTQLDGRTMYVEYVLYRDPGSRTGDKLGVVSVHGADASYEGSADIYADSADRLKFSFSFS